MAVRRPPRFESGESRAQPLDGLRRLVFILVDRRVAEDCKHLLCMCCRLRLQREIASFDRVHARPWPRYEKLSCIALARQYRGDGAGLGAFQGGHFDLDLHARVGKTRTNHRRGRAHPAEIFAQYGPALLELGAIGQDVGDANDILETRPCLAQRGLDILQALLGLLQKTVLDGHGRVVEAGGARDKDPIAGDDCARIADLIFERGARADEFSDHPISKKVTRASAQQPTTVRQWRGRRQPDVRDRVPPGRRGKAKPGVEPGRALGVGAQRNDVKMSRGAHHQSLHEERSDAKATKGAKHIDSPDPAYAGFLRVRIMRDSAHGDKSGTIEGPEKHLARAVEAVSARTKLVHDRVEKVVTVLERLRDELAKERPISRFDAAKRAVHLCVAICQVLPHLSSIMQRRSPYGMSGGSSRTRTPPSSARRYVISVSST